MWSIRKKGLISSKGDKNIWVHRALPPWRNYVCVNEKFLESSISLGFLTDVEEYESFTDEQLRKILNDQDIKRSTDRGQGSNDAWKARRDGRRGISTNMNNKCTPVALNNIFETYLTIPARTYVKWTIEKN